MTELTAWMILGAACLAWLICAANSYDDRPICVECFGTGSKDDDTDCPVCQGEGRL